MRPIFLGFRDLPGYGPHPGVPIALVLIGAGGLAGVQRGGWWGFVVGAVTMAVPILSLLFLGAHDRARDYERETRAREAWNCGGRHG
jgi:hypothetical protein